jgi:predicted amidophosphoribosyltransferase
MIRQSAVASLASLPARDFQKIQGLTMEKTVCAQCGQSVSLCQDKCPVCGSPQKRIVVPMRKESNFFARLFRENEQEARATSSS